MIRFGMVDPHEPSDATLIREVDRALRPMRADEPPALLFEEIMRGYRAAHGIEQAPASSLVLVGSLALAVLAGLAVLPGALSGFSLGSLVGAAVQLVLGAKTLAVVLFSVPALLGLGSLGLALAVLFGGVALRRVPRAPLAT